MNKTKRYFLIIVSIFFLAIILIKFHEEIPILSGIVQEYRINKIRSKLKIEPYSVELHYQLSQIYLARGEIDNYENELKLLMHLSPESQLFVEKLGDHYFKSKQYSKAIKAYEEALRINKGGENLLHFKLGNTYVNLNNHKKAIVEYKKQLELMPDNENTTKMRQFINQTINALEKE